MSWEILSHCELCVNSDCQCSARCSRAMKLSHGTPTYSYTNVCGHVMLLISHFGTHQLAVEFTMWLGGHEPHPNHFLHGDSAVGQLCSSHHEWSVSFKVPQWRVQGAHVHPHLTSTDCKRAHQTCTYMYRNNSQHSSHPRSWYSSSLYLELFSFNELNKVIYGCGFNNCGHGKKLAHVCLQLYTPFHQILELSLCCLYADCFFHD